MNHAELRAALTAEPAKRSAEIDAHLAACAECTAFVAELDAFESQLARALRVPVPARALPTQAELEAAPGVTVTPLKVAARVRRVPVWFALAATGVVAAVLVATLLTIYPRNALATALVGHVINEPASWTVTDAAVPAESVAYVLNRSGVVLAPGGAPITYAQSCMFRGWYVPHLVVQTKAGPVTVMPLRHEHVARPMTIDEAGYRGVIVPAGTGAVAVLSRGGTDPKAVEALAAEAAASIHFAD